MIIYAQDSRIRELLLDLAAKEDKHEKFFTAMRLDLSKHRNEAITFQPDDETSLYLRVWANGHVFDLPSDPVERLTGKETMEDILKVAITLEKESIGFYLGFKQGITSKTDQEKIDEIIKEEMKHIASLSTQLSALGKELM